MHQTLLEEILSEPHLYVGSIRRIDRHLWVYEEDCGRILCRNISYVPALYNIFDEILLNAADNKQRDQNMDLLQVSIDQMKNSICVHYNGDGIPDPTLQARLAIKYSTEVVIEVADFGSQSLRRQVFRNNMCHNEPPVLQEFKATENWTRVTYKPDLGKFRMTHLEDDAVALMKKRVVELAGCLSVCPGKKVRVILNGKEIEVKSFYDYAQLYLDTANKSRENPLPRIDNSNKEDLNVRWQISVSLSDGLFQQVSFVNNINTVKGGTHVDYITTQITKFVIDAVKKKDENANLKPHVVKNHLWVFVNALIDNPVFDSFQKETLTIDVNSFGTTCELSDKFLKQVVDTSGLVESLLSWEDFNLQRLNEERGAKIVHKELDLAARAELERSIPSMVDGLKPIQREVLFTAFKKNLVDKIRVDLFSGYVSEISPYLHDEARFASIESTIIGMAQNFVGSNNINLLMPHGLFGNRYLGREVAVNPSHIYTNLTEITRFLFAKDDDVDMLLNYSEEDGLKPVCYMPIIPMVLVNGAEGSGAKLTTFVPNYKPRDIIENLKRLLNNEPVEPMFPWYNNFKGEIKEVFPREDAEAKFYTVSGIIEVVTENLDSIEDNEDVTLRITELPIKRWTEDYREFIGSLATPNETTGIFIKGFSDYSAIDNVCFELVLSKRNYNIAKEEGLLKKFKLTTTLSTSNMFLFDEDNKIARYMTPEQILVKFYDLRLKCYTSRKEKMLKLYEAELQKLEKEISFIMLVNTEDFAQRKEKLLEFLQTGGAADLGGTESSYRDELFSYFESLTLDKVDPLCNKKKEVQGQIEQLKNETASSLWLKELNALETALKEKEEREEEAKKCMDLRKPLAVWHLDSSPEMSTVEMMYSASNEDDVSVYFNSDEDGNFLDSDGEDKFLWSQVRGRFLRSQGSFLRSRVKGRGGPANYNSPKATRVGIKRMPAPYWANKMLISDSVNMALDPEALPVKKVRGMKFPDSTRDEVQKQL